MDDHVTMKLNRVFASFGKMRGHLVEMSAPNTELDLRTHSRKELVRLKRRLNTMYHQYRDHFRTVELLHVQDEEQGRRIRAYISLRTDIDVFRRRVGYALEGRECRLLPTDVLATISCIDEGRHMKHRIDGAARLLWLLQNAERDPALPPRDRYEGLVRDPFELWNDLPEEYDWRVHPFVVPKLEWTVFFFVRGRLAQDVQWSTLDLEEVIADTLHRLRHYRPKIEDYTTESNPQEALDRGVDSCPICIIPFTCQGDPEGTKNRNTENMEREQTESPDDPKITDDTENQKLPENPDVTANPDNTEDLEEAERKRPVKTKCGHILCASCIDSWVKRGSGATHGCPYCRSELMSPRQFLPRIVQDKVPKVEQITTEMMSLEQETDKYLLLKNLKHHPELAVLLDAIIRTQKEYSCAWTDYHRTVNRFIRENGITEDSTNAGDAGNAGGAGGTGEAGDARGTGEVGDARGAGDTGDTRESGDAGDAGNTGDSRDTGDVGDVGDVGDARGAGDTRGTGDAGDAGDEVVDGFASGD